MRVFIFLSVLLELSVVLIILEFLVPPNERVSRNPAAINRAVLAITEPSPVFYGEDGKSISPQLIASFNQIKAEEKLFDMSQIVPMDLTPTGDGRAVFSRVADQSVSTFFNSPEIRESQFGKTATEVESKFNQNIELGNSGLIQHRLNLNVQAFQSSATLQYTGLTKLSLKYKATERKVGLELAESIGLNKKFSVNHSIVPEESLSSLNFRWAY